MKKPQNKKQKIGRWGEERAAEYLNSNGLVVLGKNIYTPYGEIDLLARDKAQLVFVEVKTLQRAKFGHPEVSVNKKKQNHMINSALHYLQENDLLETPWRIDVVAVQKLNDSRVKFDWFKNAVQI